MLSFGIVGGGNRHVILFVAHFFILMFLMIEARRYSYYLSIDWRVRLIEKEYYARSSSGMRPPSAASGGCASPRPPPPHRPLAFRGALTLRLRRTYIWIFLILTLAWVARAATYPAPVGTLRQLWEQSGFPRFRGGCSGSPWRDSTPSSSPRCIRCPRRGGDWRGEGFSIG